MGIKVRISNALAGFANNLHTPSSLPGSDTKPKYSVNLILTDESVVEEIGADKTKTKTTMDKVLLKVADEAFKGKGKTVLASLNKDKICYRDGNTNVSAKTGEIYEGFEGRKYIVAKSEHAANTGHRDSWKLLNLDRSPLNPDSGKVYSGCKINAIIDVYAITDATRKGVFSTIKIVQFAADGEAFGGTSIRVDESDIEDLSVSGDDDIAF